MTARGRIPVTTSQFNWSTLFGRAKNRLGDTLTRPLLDYIAMLCITAILVGLGLIMVFSSSMADSKLKGNSVWAAAGYQAWMVVAGLGCMWLGLKIQPQLVRRFGGLALAVSILLLVAVLLPGVGTGRDAWGAQSWINIGPVRLQPSEIVKVTLAIWGASYLADQDPSAPLRQNRIVRFMGVFGVIFLLVVLQNDIGMALTIAFVAATIVLFAGIRLGYVVAAGVLGVGAIIAFFFTNGFRSDRIRVYFNAFFGHFEDTRDTAFQSYQGFLSLGDGGVTGVGMGQSRAKWFYLPEATNDFIFAIVGEELGLWGAAMLIILFGMLGYFGLRIARRSSDSYMALLSATLTTGVVVQAFINIAYVIGLLPVTGIQLPMISSGGTSAIITLGTMGLLINCARHEPEAISAMQSYGKPSFDRLVRLREPSLDYAPKAKQARIPRQQQARVPVTRVRSDTPSGSVKSEELSRSTRPPRRREPISYRQYDNPKRRT